MLLAVGCSGPRSVAEPPVVHTVVHTAVVRVPETVVVTRVVEVTGLAESAMTESPSSAPTPSAPPTTAPTATPLPTGTLKTGDKGANVRSGPGTEYDIVGFLEPGEEATITGRYEEWLRIDYDDTDGWVAGWIVTATDADIVPQVGPAGDTPEPAATPRTTATLSVTGEKGANVRAGPGTGYETVGFLEPGDTAEITGRYDDWFQIDYDGTDGWVAGWIVTATGADNVPQAGPPGETPTSTSTPTPTSTATPATTPTRNATPNATQTPTLEPAEGMTSPKDDGFYLVGIDIASGKWHSTGEGAGCYWARRDSEQEIVDNHFGLSGGTVTIVPIDYEVEFDGCGVWEYVENAARVLAPDATGPKGDGFYTVGVEIAAGRWQSTGNRDDCYWARLDDRQEILDNHYGQAGGTVTIRADDYEVSFVDCGSWEYLGP
jgi:uncharacterized protein YraI